MQRSPALVELSREHHQALKLARDARLAAESGQDSAIAQNAQNIIRVYHDELETHFQIEEHDLLPILAQAGAADLVQRTLAEHTKLRELIQQLQQPNAACLAHFGELMHNHVRFEERELFAAAQAAGLPEKLNSKINNAK